MLSSRWQRTLGYTSILVALLSPTHAFTTTSFSNISSGIASVRVHTSQSQSRKSNRFSVCRTSLQATSNSSKSPFGKITENPTQSILFSICQAAAGASLGPFLDSYHSAFGVLQYDQPFSRQLWSISNIPALTTTWWVPPLFGLAGFLIGWLYILLDDFFGEGEESTPLGVTGPIIMGGISWFTFQYFLSGILFSFGFDRSLIFMIMSICAFVGYAGLDATKSGLVTSIATALGGPLIEVGLITFLTGTNGGYHYNDLGETGFFPLWIIPVYFLGGPANGNLARGVFKFLGEMLEGEDDNHKQNVLPKGGCLTCKDTRRVPCPNCDGVGYYVTYNREVKCNCCKGSGFVICRDCFDWYGEDPSDIGAIREKMARMPD